MKTSIKIVTMLVVLAGFLCIPDFTSAPAAAHSAANHPAALPVPQGTQAPKEGASIPYALPKGKKLILKDGTFQIVREYSVEGDRVRYYSTERSAWEEIPAQMVDWDATHKFEAEQATQDAVLKSKIHASAVAERTSGIDVDRSLEIKPGLFLPDAVGFYALDANKTLHEMKQSLATTDLSKGREVGRLLSPIPIIPRKQSLQLPNARAALRISTRDPEFFMRPADEREPHFRLLHAQIKNGRRILEDIRTYMTGDQTHQGQEIDFQTWTPARGVFRYTVNQRLEPGEYAFVEMISEGVSGYVWDFGIDAPDSKSRK
jgi:hypothetical protein